MRRVIGTVAVALLAAATLAACSGSSKKTLSFCEDPTYPPAEFYKVGKVGTRELARTLSGADIDVARAVADKLDRTARFKDVSFSGIIPALLDKRCDAIISFMNDTAQRRKQVTFVDYVAAGQSVMLKKDAPAVSSVADLYGRTVAVAKGTTEAQFLTARNAAAPAGKSIKILSFSTEDDAIYAVQKGAAQIYFGDAPIVLATVAADHSLVSGPQLVAPIPIGMAFRPGDARIDDVKKAVKDLYASGKMGKILADWNLSRFAITP